MGQQRGLGDKLVIGSRVIHRTISESGRTILSFGRFRFILNNSDNISEEYYLGSLTEVIGYYDLLSDLPITMFDVYDNILILDLPQHAPPRMLKSNEFHISLNVLGIDGILSGDWTICGSGEKLLTTSCRLCIEYISISPSVDGFIKKAPLNSYISSDTGLLMTVYNIVVPTTSMEQIKNTFREIRETMVNLYLGTLMYGKDVLTY